MTVSPACLSATHHVPASWFCSSWPFPPFCPSSEKQVVLFPGGTVSKLFLEKRKMDCILGPENIKRKHTNLWLGAKRTARMVDPQHRFCLCLQQLLEFWNNFGNGQNSPRLEPQITFMRGSWEDTHATENKYSHTLPPPTTKISRYSQITNFILDNEALGFFANSRMSEKRHRSGKFADMNL